MKKTIIFALGLAVLTLSACSTDSYEDWADPQSNPQEDAYTVAFSAASAGAIDLNTTTDDQVKLITPSVETSATISKQALGVNLYNAEKNASFHAQLDGDGNISSADLEDNVVKLYGEQETALNVPIEVVYTITLVNGDAYIRTAETTATVTLKKVDPSEFLYVGDKRLRVNDDNTNYEGFLYLSAGSHAIQDKDGNEKATVTVEEDGVYQVDVAADYTVTTTQVTKIGLIGDFNSWGDDVEMTYDKASDSYIAKDVTFPSATSFKIRMNADWAISWGGKDETTVFGNLTHNNGQNLTIDAGTYDFTLKLSYEGNTSLTFVKK